MCGKKRIKHKVVSVDLGEGKPLLYLVLSGLAWKVGRWEK